MITLQWVLVALIVVVAVGVLIFKLPPSNCKQDCKQGRNCNCGGK